MPLTLKQHTYEVIRGKLLGGTLKPGSRLSDDHLARELGISRSPVREAINQLASEGLLELRPRSGAYVKEPDPDELEELYELREALEGFAARKAATRIDRAGQAELDRLCRDMRAVVEECRARPTKIADADLVQRFLANDLEFHKVILSAAGNGRMTKLVADFKILTRVFGYVPVDHDLPLMANSYLYHKRVAQAVRRRDARAAGSWMVKHIRAAKHIVLEGYRRRTAGG